MTGDPRADELLREALDSDYKLADSSDYQLVPSEWVAKVRAYLDEPQPEPKYVWRVIGSDQDGDWAHHMPMYDDEPEITAIRYRQGYGGTIERAQIGPWERVDD